MSNKKLREAVIIVMEDEEKYVERNVNNVTTDTLFQSPVTVNAQKKDANMTYVPNTTPVAIGTIDQLVTDEVLGIQEILGLHQMALPKASITDAARSCARIFWTLKKASCKCRDGSTPRDVNFNEANSRLDTPSPSSNPNSIFPARTGIKEISNPRWSIIARWARNVEPLDSPINGFSAVNGQLMSLFSKVIGVETFLREMSRST